MIKLLALTLSLMVASLAEAQPLAASPPSAPAISAAPSSTPQRVDLEVARLQGQLDTLRTFHDSMLNTVYWALATIATLAVLLVGYNWFTNYRMAEREKQALRQELVALIETNLSELQRRNQKQMLDELEK